MTFQGKSSILSRMQPTGPPVNRGFSGHCVALEIKTAFLRINSCQKSGVAKGYENSANVYLFSI